MNTTEEKLVAAMSGLVGIQQFIVGLPSRETPAQQILKSAPYQEFVKNNGDNVRIELKTAITSTGLMNDPLVPTMKPPIDPGTRRVLSVRDLLVSFPTLNGAIEMPIKTGATNNAGPQVGNSPLQRENVALGESSYTFTNSFLPILDVGHFARVSTQVFTDAGTLDGFIQGEMAHGVQLATENQLLNGDGSTGQLTGLLAGATAYTPTSPNMVNPIDILRHAILQVQLADFTPEAIILNPGDWYDIDTRKAGSGNDQYSGGAPRSMNSTRVWGLPVYVTNSIASGTFLLGDFSRSGGLFVRQGATVEISRHDASNFREGLLTIRAQERLAWVTTNAAALVKGAL